MRRRWMKPIAIIAVTAFLITGCSAGQSTSNSTQTTTETQTADSTETDTVQQLSAVSDTSQIVVDTEFTASDLEVGYEDSTATHVTLDGSSIDVSGDGATATDGVLTINDEGVYVITGTLNDGQIVVDAEDSDKVQIVLNGVEITCSDNAPTYIKNADKVFITLAENTVNTLADGSEYVQADDETSVDSVIFSKSDLTINGSGTLNITGNYKHGIVSKDDLVITGGIFNITAVGDALNGKDCVKIKNGTFTINVTEGNGIQSKNGDDTTKGYVYICGGEINITNCQEGIEGTAIIITDGTIHVTAQDDGLNAASGSSSTTESTSTDQTIENTSANTATANSTAVVTYAAIADTTALTTVSTAADAGGFTQTGRQGGGAMENDTNCYISIAGGNVTVNAEGDGIDSNGSLYISGGTINVSGPTNSGNGGLDYNGTAEITGGTVVVAGSSGMAQGFSDTSSQYSILYNFSTACAAGTEVKLTDADGNVIISYTPDKQFQSVVISTPDLKKDGTYTITSGDQTAEVTLSSVSTSVGQQSMGGQAGMGGRGQFENGGPGGKMGTGAPAAQ